MKRNKLDLLIFILLVGIGVFFVSTKKSRPQNITSKKITITASFYPLAFLAKRIGDEYVDVINLTPAGAEPHDFEPTTKDMATIEKSSLLIMNGMGVEMYEKKLNEQLAGSSVKIVLAGKEFAIQDIVKDGTKRKDPHVWVDPVLYGKMAQKIAGEMGKLDTAHASEYKKNANQLVEELNSLDRSYKQELASCTLHKIVTAHTAFGYLAHRYGFEQIGISGISPEEEPSPKELKLITDFVKKEGVNHILLEELAPRVWGETVAAETGAQVLVLNPLEGITPDEEKDGVNYISIQKKNIESLKIALQCK
ncbi:ABC transporter substrate-binding protein [Candidatus Roizmanbacteria bacterium CG_4_10_14_0_8_um_filter_33_9]|uniref:ABC transporter substrate-binding protein n=1 Tax=Candidatus Roizmanbacteria bacterium CG_4_10_14_0_8_um_filter_33_9 TaxID=1974826 RepID=A0A2M7QJI0_9BACT|nr:MAG: ABC transporter substrate-binding protein [Candidatus Roizmanbacteria bacterium CG_4_10_14_0_8_um_filter_33_9]